VSQYTEVDGLLQPPSAATAPRTYERSGAHASWGSLGADRRGGQLTALGGRTYNPPCGSPWYVVLPAW